MATVYIPSLMHSHTGGLGKVSVPGSTVGQVIDNLEKAYPGLKQRIVENGRLKPNISVAIDGEVTPLGMSEHVGEDSEVHFLPAISGGAHYSIR